MKKSAQTITPLPFAVYFWSVAVLVGIGLADSIYLTVSHYRVYMDIGYKSFCAISRAINCDTVSQSPYSILLGIPVPVWGVIGYMFLVLLLPFAARRDADKIRIWALIFWISLGFSGYSLILAFISTYFIGSYCIMCILTYGVNLVLALYSWIIRKRFSKNDIFTDSARDFMFLWRHKAKSLVLFVSFLAAVVVCWIVFPAYWNFKPAALSRQVPTGITTTGHPWIGAENPVVEITEFTDYQCFQCKKMHFYLRQLIAENPDKIRLIHRHYPMDHAVNPAVAVPFHVGSGVMALVAISAEAQDKFWQMNDLLFSRAGKTDVIDIQRLARETGLNYSDLSRTMKARNTHDILRKDIRDGNRLKITGTPAYVINDQLYLGQIPPDIIQRALK